MKGMKRQKGRVSRIPQIGQKKLGTWGIVSKESGRITEKHMETVIMTLKRSMGTGVKIIPRVYASIAVSKKPLEVRMGKGKGVISKRIARVRPNTIIVEIGRTKGVSKTVLESAAGKLPVRTIVIEN